MKKELFLVKKSSVKFEEEIVPLLEELEKSDPYLSTEIALKAMLKMYTCEACYYKLGLAHNNCRFKDV